MSRASATRGMAGLTAASVEPVIAPARATWAAAGGAAPGIGAVDLGGGAVAPTLAPDDRPTTVLDRLSSFQQIGKECFATCRIHATGTGSLTGAASVTGLPVAPLAQGVSGEGGQNVGWGFLASGTANTMYFVNAVLDPTYSTTIPILFLHAGIDPDDAAGDGGARAASLGSFGGTPNVFVAGNSPFDFNGTQFFLNLTFHYEGV